MDEFVQKYEKFIWKQARHLAFIYGVRQHLPDIAQSGFEGLCIGYKNAKTKSISYANMYAKRFMLNEIKKIKRFTTYPPDFEISDNGEEVAETMTRIDILLSL